MAELGASVITIAEVSKTIIEKIFNYIKEVHLVNETIQDLLVNLEELHSLIELVSDTYHKTKNGDNDSSARFVFEKLKICQERLARLDIIIINLAQLDNETLIDKWILKRKSDKMKTEITRATGDLQRNMGHIRDGIHAWSLVLHRRISDAIAIDQTTVIRTELQASITKIHPLSWTDKGIDRDLNLDLRRVKTETSDCRRLSISSSTSAAASLSRSDGNDSIISTSCTTFNNQGFYSLLSRCSGDEQRMQQIRRILEQPEGTKLANATNHAHRTPLHVAAQLGDVKLAEVLVWFRADINAKDSEQASVLDLAIEGRNNIDFVAFLLGLGVVEHNILARNTSSFMELKSIIEFKKATRNATKKKSRTLSSRLRHESPI
jgi:hypothetical protein